MYRSLVEIRIVSFTTAFHAISRDPTVLENPSLHTKCCRVLQGLDEAVVALQREIREEAQHHPGRLHDGVPFVLTSACNTLCASIVSLARTDALSASNGLTVPKLVTHLVKTFEGAPFEQGVRVLLEFRAAQHAATLPADPEVRPALTTLTDTRVGGNASGATGSERGDEKDMICFSDSAIIGSQVCLGAEYSITPVSHDSGIDGICR